MEIFFYNELRCLAALNSNLHFRDNDLNLDFHLIDKGLENSMEIFKIGDSYLNIFKIMI